MKLTKAQQRVIDLMRTGWELYSSDLGVLLQEGGIGRGGETEKVSRTTLEALLDRGAIVRGAAEYPGVKYRLAMGSQSNAGEATHE